MGRQDVLARPPDVAPGAVPLPGRVAHLPPAVRRRGSGRGVLGRRTGARAQVDSGGFGVVTQLPVRESFLQDYYRDRVQEVAENYPEKGRSVTVAFNDVQLRDPDLADYLLQKPRHCLQVGAQMLQAVDVTVTPRPRLQLRVDGLPHGELVPIRALRVEHLNRLVAVEGLVKKHSPVRPQLLEATRRLR